MPSCRDQSWGSRTQNPETISFHPDRQEPAPMEQACSRRHGSDGVAAAVNLSHASFVWQTLVVGGVLGLGSSFSRTCTQSSQGSLQWVYLYDMTLIGLGRGICGQAELIKFSLLVIQYLGQRLGNLGMVILSLVKFYWAPTKCVILS